MPEFPECESTIEQEYMDLLMDRPFEIIKEELEYVEYITFDETTIASEEFLIKRKGRITSNTNCNCKIFHSYGLPCRHIFAARNIKLIDLFDERLCHERWTKKHCKNFHRVFVENHEYEVRSPETTKKVYNVSNRELKIVKLQQIISDLTDIASLSCGTNFTKKMCVCTKSWIDGRKKSMSTLSKRKTCYQLILK